MSSDTSKGTIPKEVDIASASAPEIRGISSPIGPKRTRHRSRSRHRTSEGDEQDHDQNGADPIKGSRPQSLQAGLLSSDNPSLPPARAGKSLKRKPTKPLIDSSKTPSRTRTLLQRLGTIKTPITPVSGWMNRAERYTQLDDPTEDEPVGVDISSLGGPGHHYQLHELASPTQPLAEHLAPASEYSQEDSGSQNPKGALGDGMVVGAEFKLDETPAVIHEDHAGIPHRTLTASEQLRRRKTIRDQALAVAQKKQVIVAVNEAVDLSSLEDSGRRNTSGTMRSNTTLDAIEQQSNEKNSQSYFYPEDPQMPNWKPFSMTSIYIIMLIVVTLTLAAIQEWLYQFANSKSREGKGVLTFDGVADVSLVDFFAWKYMPTLIFVAYGVLWSIMDYEIKRLEPYYQLSRRNGAVASQSINLDHLTLWSYLVPFKAFRFKQWAVFYSALGNLLATSVAASLQNPSIQFQKNKKCQVKNDKPNCPDNEHLFYVSIDSVWSRLLTVSLIATGVLGIVLLFQLRRKSGLLSDPKGIAGIASMATKSHILQDFVGLDLANHRQIHKRLQDRRYILYKSSIWQGEYSKKIDDYEPPDHKGPEDPHPLMLRWKTGVVFIGSLVFCLIIIPVINFTPARAIPNKAGWLPILIATLIKMVWTTFEFDVRLIEPFYILSKGNAYSDETLTLDYQGTPYGWLPLKALLNGHYIVALVGLGSILTDVLTVTVSSFSVNGDSVLRHPRLNTSDEDETFKSFMTSVVLSETIVAFLIATALLVYLRRGHPFLPREPSTIAAVLAFIHASKMLGDFIGTERFTEQEMEDRLRGRRKRYGFGWVKGRDGNVHCAIDEEPMRTGYRHGSSYEWATAPWEGGGGHLV